MSYDQWKTASPYDDEPDFVELAEKYIKRNERPDGPNDAVDIMRGLLEYIDENV